MDEDKIKEVFEKNERIVRVCVYHDGWVPNSYKYRCPGKMTVYNKGKAPIQTTYDRKRSYGKGPRLTAFSAKGGCLYRE